MRIYILNGKPRAGKDTFVKIYKERHNSNTLNLSWADPAKQISKSQDRKELSDLTDILEKYNVQMNYISDKINDTHCEVVFIHCRSSKNISKLVKKLKVDATIHLTRTNYQNDLPTNHADKYAEACNYNYDYKFKASSLHELEAIVDKFERLELIKRLEYLNKWRKGEADEMPDPTSTGVDIEKAINFLRK